MTRIFNSALLAMLLIVLVGAVGCSSSSSSDAAIRSVNNTNLQRLANLYSMHQFKNQFKGPADEAMFREYLAGPDPTKVLESMGVAAGGLDKLFISERDGEPFKIRYGVISGPRGSTEAVIFESKGKLGKRMVGFLNMVQREVEDQEYESLLNPKK